MEDLASFDEDLSDCLYKLPTENLPLVSLTLTHADLDLIHLKMADPVIHQNLLP